MSSFRSKKGIPIRSVKDFEQYKIDDGSLLEFERPTGSHWAVYVGEGKICHLTEDPEKLGDRSDVKSLSGNSIICCVTEDKKNFGDGSDVKASSGDGKISDLTEDPGKLGDGSDVKVSSGDGKISDLTKDPGKLGDGSDVKALSGDGKISHLTEGPDKPGDRSDVKDSTSFKGVRAVIKEEYFEDMLKREHPKIAFVNNFTDAKTSPLEPHEIVKRARSQIGNTTFTQLPLDSKRFAHWCRYEERRSQQEGASLTERAVAWISSKWK